MICRHQRYTLVARAIVGYEIERGSERILTVPLLREKYGLDWGLYSAQGPPRADQLLRNELNVAVRECRLTRLEERDGQWIQYVRLDAHPAAATGGTWQY